MAVISRPSITDRIHELPAAALQNISSDSQHLRPIRVIVTRIKSTWHLDLLVMIALNEQKYAIFAVFPSPHSSRATHQHVQHVQHVHLERTNRRPASVPAAAEKERTRHRKSAFRLSFPAADPSESPSPGSARNPRIRRSRQAASADDCASRKGREGDMACTHHRGARSHKGFLARSQ